MTILILTDYYPPDKVGGVGAIARGLAEAYRALGHRVLVLTTGEQREEERRQGILRGSRRLGWGVLSNNIRALRLIAREGVDLVHLHQSGTTFFLFARRMFERFPFVLDSLQVSYASEAREIRPVTLGPVRFAPRWREYVERFVLAPAHMLVDIVGFALSDAVTVVSRANREEIADTYGTFAPRNIHVVPNGVDAIPPGTEGRDESLEARLQGRVVIAHIGVFRTRKRVSNLLLALREIAASCPDAVVLLVGGGRGYDERVRQLARDLGIADRVLMTGSVPADHIPYYLSLTDIVCLLSSYEGMPMALLEAMHAGKAVVATDGYGMRDLLEDPGAGCLVPVDDIPATARVLAELVRDPRRRQALGAAARARVLRDYRWDTIARRYLAVAGMP